MEMCSFDAFNRMAVQPEGAPDVMAVAKLNLSLLTQKTNSVGAFLRCLLAQKRTNKKEKAPSQGRLLKNSSKTPEHPYAWVDTRVDPYRWGLGM